MIQRPTRLSDHIRFEPLSLSVTLPVDSLPSAQMTLPADAEIGMHDVLEIFTAQGSAGLFRVTSKATTYADQVTVSLTGCADWLSDDVYPGTGDLSGTASTVLSGILAQQTTARWQLGTCAASGTVKISNSYGNLWNLMESVRGNFMGYEWKYNYATTPWTVSLVAPSSTLAAEFRIGRNVESATVDISDAEMCTRLYMTVTNPITGAGTLTVYNNAAAQATYGIIVKTADVRSDMVSDPAAYAAAILAERAEPIAYISISGYDLHALTGDAFDRITLGSLCRVTLPGIGTLTERVTSINWPDALGEPEKITVSLANNLKPFAESLNLTKRTASGAAAKAEEEEQELVRHQSSIDRTDGRLSLWATESQWAEMAQQYELSRKTQVDITSDGFQSICLETGSTQGVTQFDATHNYVYGEKCIKDGALYRCSNQSGHTGAWSSADFSAVQSQQSMIDQTAGRVALVVDQNGIRAGQIVLAINGGTGHSEALIEADKVQISGNTTLDGVLTVSGGNLVCKGEGAGARGTFEADTIEALYIDMDTGGIIDTTTLNANTIGNVNSLTLDDGTTDVELTPTNVSGLHSSAAISGNTLTVSKLGGGDAFSISKNAAGDTLTITAGTGNFTFSKAVSLSGGWSGGTYSVSATSGTISGTAPSTSPHITLEGNGGTNFSAKLYENSTDTGVTATYGYLHQSGSSVGVYTSYNSSTDTYSGIIASVSVTAPTPTVSVAFNNLINPQYNTSMGAWFATIPYWITINGTTGAQQTDTVDIDNVVVALQNAEMTTATLTPMANSQPYSPTGKIGYSSVTVSGITVGSTAYSNQPSGKELLRKFTSNGYYTVGGDGCVQVDINSGGAYDFSCTENAATWTQSISGYLSCGAISKASISANTYLRFRIKCDNAYKYCYITVNA